MKKIEKIDRRFAFSKVSYNGMKLMSIQDAPFEIYGLFKPEEGTYKRLPKSVAKATNPGVLSLHTNTSGGRIRFKTDSTKIVIKYALPSITSMLHMPFTGSSCFDLYADGEYADVFLPKINPTSGYIRKKILGKRCEAEIDFPNKKLRDITINFPLYNDVSSVFIALEKDAQILSGNSYKNSKPIVFYGSSITQGGCASHAGNCYPAIISRRLDSDFINLGFSGSCHAEDSMAQYISTLDMSVLVYDYDHNASSVKELEETHEKFFKAVRKNQPELPIVMVSVASRYYGDTTEARKAVIKRTYDNALKSGDKNVYFIDGQEMYKSVGIKNCTVDTSHPNDLGFWLMAEKIGDVLEFII